ncbi:MAG: AsnC family transcriptional regulator [Candidatus Nitrosocaldaceae archaeon]|nr:MAG: AsnC family transcriptional regulator [Candidatus Nitrosocaldaceae archaeon]
MHIKLDHLDIRILKELLINSKRSYHQLAYILDVSPTTILKRVKALERSGLIKYYSAILDHKMLGFSITAIIEVSSKDGKILDIDDEIAKNSSVCAVYDTTGVYDAIVIAKFKSIEELDSFIKDLNNTEGVEKTNTHIVLNTIKEDFRLI